MMQSIFLEEACPISACMPGQNNDGRSGGEGGAKAVFFQIRGASIVGEAGNNQPLQVCKEKGRSGFLIFLNFYVVHPAI